jgi:hypothetical protein
VNLRTHFGENRIRPLERRRGELSKAEEQFAVPMVVQGASIQDRVFHQHRATSIPSLIKSDFQRSGSISLSHSMPAALRPAFDGFL